MKKERKGFFTVYENGAKVFWSELGWTFGMVKQNTEHTNNIKLITDENDNVLWSQS